MENLQFGDLGVDDSMVDRMLIDGLDLMFQCSFCDGWTRVKPNVDTGIVIHVSDGMIDQITCKSCQLAN